MAKLKPAGRNKPRLSTKAQSIQRAIPCLVLILVGIALLCALFYFALQSSSS